MIDEQTQETASLYALGLLSPEEKLSFDAQMQADEDLVRLVQELEEGAASLALAAPAMVPPAAMKERILSQIRSDSKKIIPFPKASAWVPWAVAASFAIAASYLLVDRGHLQNEIGQLEQRVELSQIRVATLTSLLKDAPGSVAAVAWDEHNQKGLLDVRNLPPLEEGQDYQLWIVDPSYKQPVSAGILRVRDGVARAEFRPEQPVASADKFAISVEKKGGTPPHSGPLGPVVMAGQ